MYDYKFQKIRHLIHANTSQENSLCLKFTLRLSMKSSSGLFVCCNFVLRKVAQSR